MYFNCFKCTLLYWFRSSHSTSVVFIFAWLAQCRCVFMLVRATLWGPTLAVHWRSEAILAGSLQFQGLIEGEEPVARSKLGSGQGLWRGMYSVDGSPHKGRSTRMCERVSCWGPQDFFIDFWALTDSSVWVWDCIKIFLAHSAIIIGINIVIWLLSALTIFVSTPQKKNAFSEWKGNREKSKDFVCLFLCFGLIVSFLSGFCVPVRWMRWVYMISLNEYINSAVFFCTVKHLYSLYLFYNKDCLQI